MCKRCGLPMHLIASDDITREIYILRCSRCWSITVIEDEEATHYRRISEPEPMEHELEQAILYQ